VSTSLNCAASKAAIATAKSSTPARCSMILWLTVYRE
jgi:hypothetical protein